MKIQYRIFILFFCRFWMYNRYYDSLISSRRLKFRHPHTNVQTFHWEKTLSFTRIKVVGDFIIVQFSIYNILKIKYRKQLFTFRYLMNSNLRRIWNLIKNLNFEKIDFVLFGKILQNISGHFSLNWSSRIKLKFFTFMTFLLGIYSKIPFLIDLSPNIISDDFKDFESIGLQF